MHCLHVRVHKLPLARILVSRPAYVLISQHRGSPAPISKLKPSSRLRPRAAELASRIDVFTMLGMLCRYM